LIDNVLQVRFQGAVQLIKDAYQSWTFDDMSFPANLVKRGVADPALLPYYPYRDDGMLIWQRLGNYINDYIALYYLGDDDVTADYELQNRARQLSGAPDDGAGKFPVFPLRSQRGLSLTRLSNGSFGPPDRNMRRSTFRKSISPPSFPMRRE
jgi:arachidonate 15-lipoxygenase